MAMPTSNRKVLSMPLPRTHAKKGGMKIKRLPNNNKLTAQGINEMNQMNIQNDQILCVCTRVSTEMDKIRTLSKH